MSRTLYHIPIIHSEADLGDLGESIKQAVVEASGQAVYDRKNAFVETLWQSIAQWCASLSMEGEAFRLYQDGLPVCGHESKIVAELASNGSVNHQLLESLIQRGATLMGTESAPLLVKEYEQIKAAVDRGRTQQAGRDPQLLIERDRAIADRIDDTLEEGETGILFIGMLHRVPMYLAPNIEVVYPFGQAREAA